MSGPVPPRAWLVVGLLWFVGALNYLDRIMITTMHGSLLSAIPMTEAQYGSLTAVFLWVYAAVSPLAGYLSDRFPRSRVIIASLLIWSAITWLTGQAQNFDQLLTTRALLGISEACFVPAALALVTDYHRGATRSFATGLYITGGIAGSGLGGVGGWLAEREHNWAYAFHLFGLIGIAYAVVLVFCLRDAPTADGEKSSSDGRRPKVRFFTALRSLFSHPSFVVVFAFWGLVAVTTWGITGWMPTYLGEHFHLGQGKAGLSATGYLNAAMAVGLLIGGMWADRWSGTQPRARMAVPVLGLLAAVPGILLAANSSVFVGAITGLILFGLTRPFTDANIMPIVCLVTDARYRATGFGVVNLFATLWGGLAIYAGGVLRDAHVNVAYIFRVSAVLLVVCAGLLLLVRPREDGKAANT